MAQTRPARPLQRGEPRSHRRARRGAWRSSCAARSTIVPCATPRSPPSRSPGSASSPSCRLTDLERGLAPERLRDLDSAVREDLSTGNLAGLRVWNRDGRVVYADEGTLVGQQLEPSEGLRTALERDHEQPQGGGRGGRGGDGRGRRSSDLHGRAARGLRAAHLPGRDGARRRLRDLPSLRARGGHHQRRHAQPLPRAAGRAAAPLPRALPRGGRRLQAAAPARRREQAPGAARRAHRAAQPDALPRPHRAGAPAVAPRAGARRRAADRPRPLQGGQRHARPPEGRPPPQGHRRAPAGDAARQRHDRPPRRRRVRRAAADARQRRRGGVRRREDPRARSRRTSTSTGCRCTWTRAWASRSTRSTGRTWTRSSSTPTWPCTRPSARTAATRSTRSSTTPTTRSASPWSGSCARASPTTRCCSTTSPRSTWRRGKVVGAEALVRWQHPERGLILPAEFVPMAERTGLIKPLSRYVLDHGARAVPRVARVRARPEDLGEPVGAQPARPDAFPRT